MADAMVTFSFPDEIRPKSGPHPSRQQALAWAPRSQQLPPSATSWLGQYPAIIPRVKRVPRQQDFPPPQLFPVVVPLFGWHAEYPTVLNRRRLVTGAQPAVVNPLTPTYPVLVEWLPSYPSVHWTRGLKAALQQVFTQNLDPITNPPSPDLAWGPFYPDYIWPKVGLKPGLQQASANDPRIHPPSPELAWQPDYPDRIWRQTIAADRIPAFSYVERVANIPPDIGMNWQQTRPEMVLAKPRLQGHAARPVEVPISPVVWLSERMDPPDVPIRRQFLIPGGTASPTALVVIAERVSWQTELPIPSRVRPTIISGGFASYVPGPSPVPPITDEWCIRFADEIGAIPMLAGEAVGLATFFDETVISSQMADEEVC